MFDEWVLAQHTLVDVSDVDAGTDLLGYPSAMRLMLSPTGMSRSPAGHRGDADRLSSRDPRPYPD
ncbi:MAG: alpha-hydroxy-acid oxidizing protein [Sphingopyxis sp.]|nr:alpha-hydroxy-acid oxidizing protein [Sphingopyxis sp.]